MVLKLISTVNILRHMHLTGSLCLSYGRIRHWNRGCATNKAFRLIDVYIARYHVLAGKP